MIYIQLYCEFFKIGLFAIGGGMATLPFLQELSRRTGWFTASFITDMIAISESTPGPIGINMATYVGFNVGGIPGALAATLGTITPAIIIVTIVSYYVNQFRDSKIVNDIFYGLRPAVTGLIAAAGFSVMTGTFLHLSDYSIGMPLQTLVEPVKLVFFLAAFIAITKFNKHPVLYIAVAAVAGLILKL